jgi:F420H(2)-dependent biliverdin reductase
MRPARTPSDSALARFLAQDQVAALTTMRPDGRPHVAPVRFTWDAGARMARVLTRAGTRKARNVLAGPGGPAVLCQSVGFRWVTLEGPATVCADPARIEVGVHHYLRRYGVSPPSPPDLVVLEIAVERIRGLNV